MTNRLSLTEIMESKLIAAFQPLRMDVVNESHMHAGHQPGFDGTGYSHMRVRLVCAQFSGMSRLARQRAVLALFADELANGLHALAIEASAPGEAIAW